MLLLLLGFGRVARAQWQWLNPKPNAYANKVVRFVDARQGVVLQTLGQVLRTDDAGATWQEVRRFADASALDFSPQGVGYLLTKPGVLWRSTDAGRTWTRRSGAPQPAPGPYYYGGLPPLTHTYSQVHAVSADTVVEVASDGLVRRSVDGGLSWRQASSQVSEVLSSSFPSGRVGYLGTWGGRIYKTTDGGLTWAKLSEQNYFPSEITMLRFLTPTLGFAHREHSDLLRTQDGGATWTLVSSQLEDFSDLQFVSPTVGFAAGDYGTIYTTRDGGNSWALIGPATTSGLMGGNYWRSVWFTSATTGYVVGQSNQGSLLRTTDGGRTWQPQPGLLGTIRALEFPGHGLVGYALSDTGLLKTTDGGDTWAKLAAGGTLLSCPDANTIVTGGGNVVMRSGDGGATWKTTVIPARYGLGNSLVTLRMASTQVGYLATEDSAVGQILARTTDGGQTWEMINGPQLNGLRNFDFVTPTTGYATGYRDLYQTTDGGQSWQVLPVGDYWGLSDVNFVDEQVGYAIDEYGLVYKTQDGARTWQMSQINHSQYAPGHAKHVRFLDRNTGCVQTDNADVFRTTDGGRTWLWEFNLGSVALAYTHQGQSVVLGGGNGMLVRRSLSTNPLPFRARVLAPPVLTDSSAVLSGTLTAENCIVDSARFEFSPLSTPGFSYRATALPVLWYGGDSLRTTEVKGLQATTTYRVRLRLRHNGAYYYSPDTVFTTPAAPVLPPVEPAAYPNPTAGYVRVVEPGRRASARIKVFTLSGVLVREASGAGIDLAGLLNGMYLLHIALDERTYHCRVVKQ